MKNGIIKEMVNFYAWEKTCMTVYITLLCYHATFIIYEPIP